MHALGRRWAPVALVWQAQHFVLLELLLCGRRSTLTFLLLRGRRSTLCLWSYFCVAGALFWVSGKWWRALGCWWAPVALAWQAQHLLRWRGARDRPTHQGFKHKCLAPNGSLCQEHQEAPLNSSPRHMAHTSSPTPHIPHLVSRIYFSTEFISHTSSHTPHLTQTHLIELISHTHLSSPYLHNSSHITQLTPLISYLHVHL